MADSRPAAPPVFTDGTVPTVTQLNALATSTAYGSQMGFDGCTVFGPVSALTTTTSGVTVIPLSNIRNITGNGASMYTNGVGQLTIQTPGVYQIDLLFSANSIPTAASGSGMLLEIRHNTTSRAGVWSQSVGSSQQGARTTASFYCAAGDTVDAAIEFSNGATVPVAGSGGRGTTLGAWGLAAHSIVMQIRCICPGSET